MALIPVAAVYCGTVDGFHKWPVCDLNEWHYVQETLSGPALQLFMLFNKLGWTHFISGRPWSEGSFSTLRRMMVFQGIPRYKHIGCFLELIALAEEIQWDLRVEGVADL